jgi:pimeloyl-ACP methyl ester carboxylesterase
MRLGRMVALVAVCTLAGWVPVAAGAHPLRGAVGQLLKTSVAKARDAAYLGWVWKPVAHARDARVARGFTPEFASWLHRNGYGREAFADPDRPAYSSRARRGRGVVLVHGHADSAEGWARVIPVLEAAGLRPFPLSMGHPQKFNLEDSESREKVHQVSRFVRAVGAYTGEPVDLVSHSMGSLASWRAIDELHATPGHPVDTFVSISGPNLGLAPFVGQAFNPLMRTVAPTVSALDPLRLQYHHLKRRGLPIRTFSIYGTGDGLLGWDVTRTAPIPHEERRFELANLGHMEARDKSARLVAAILRDEIPRDWQSLIDP